jgi:2-polyprenyl-3-methyl-5-hydroxy-6-metoxy-1,4-benzoquinol methylase
VTPVAQVGQINRHEQRRSYFFDALLELAGGSLAGRRVLDLGCNAGMWSLLSLEAGADFVLGLDVHAPYIEQAELVFAAKGIDPARYRFEQADIFERDFAESFDVVLCLGVMEMSARPLELFELFRRVGAGIVVIDTAISPARFSCFEMVHVDDPRERTRQSLVLLPTMAAVGELAREFGMQTVALAHNMSDYAGMEDYRRGRRYAFIAVAPEMSLASLQGRRVEPPQPWWQQAGDPRKLRGALDRGGLQMARERLRRRR